jgi:hypothetical protein
MLTSTVLGMVHSEQAPSDDEWEAAMSLLAEHRRPDGELVAMFVVTAGGAPTVAQRRRGNQITMGRNCVRAVCTDSKATLVIVRGLSWFAPGLQSFSPKALFEGLSYVGVPVEEIPTVWASVNELNARLTTPISWLKPEAPTAP